MPSSTAGTVQAARVGEFPGVFRDQPGNQGVGNQALATPVSGKLLSQPGQVLRAGMDRGDHGERVADRLDGGSVQVRNRDLGSRTRAIPVAAASLLPLAAAGPAHRVPPGKRIHPPACPDEGTFEPDPRGRPRAIVARQVPSARYGRRLTRLGYLWAWRFGQGQARSDREPCFRVLFWSRPCSSGCTIGPPLAFHSLCAGRRDRQRMRFARQGGEGCRHFR